MNGDIKKVKKNVNTTKINKEKYNNAVIENIQEYCIGNQIISKNNVKNYYDNLSYDNKRQLTVLELNIIYLLLNNYYPHYISDKKELIATIDDYQHYMRRSDALLKPVTNN